MSARGKWLHAGVRADPAARDATRAQGRRGSFARMAAEQEAKDLWRRGYVRPWLISTALNFADLYGPDADAAVGVEEPALDRWEDGSLYPTWEDLKRLAAATRFPVSFFTRPTVEPMTSTRRCASTCRHAAWSRSPQRSGSNPTTTAPT